jgi:nitroreductase
MATVATELRGEPTAMTVDQVLSTTRSVRRHLDLTRPVPRELIEQCIQLAQQAPTSGNSQAAHYLVVTDAAKKAALTEVYVRSWNAFLAHTGTASYKLDFQDPLHTAQQPRVAGSAQHLADHMAEVPVLVVPCVSPRPDNQPVWIQEPCWASILPQAWSFMLAARARGLASTLTTLHNMFEEDAALILGIPYADFMQAGILAVAYPDKPDFKPAYREPLERFLHWDTW